MSGCFSSVSQVYRKRDRLDPGGDNRCDGAEHDRGCAYEPRWRRLQVRCRGDSGESKNRAGEPLKARRVRAIGHLNFLGRWPATTRRGGIRNRADRRSAAVTWFANSRSRRCGSCISWAAATLNRETEHCEGPPAACDRCTGAVAPNRFPISEILPHRSRIPPQFRPSASPSNLETLLDRMAPSQTFWARCGC